MEISIWEDPTPGDKLDGRRRLAIFLRATRDIPAMLIVPSNRKETIVFELRDKPLGISSHEYVPYEECTYT